MALQRYRYNIRNVRVIDGDTIECDLINRTDLGFNDFVVSERKKRNFRLYGINTPELRGKTPGEREAAREAKEWLIRRIEDITVEKIILESHKDKQGKYGRYLATLYDATTNPFTNINEEMVQLNLAVPYMV